MARCTNAPVFERPEEEVAEKEMEIFEYLEREVLENERCVTYKEVAAKVDYYFIEVAKAVKKFYEEHKNRPGLTAIFNISGIKWHETEADFKARKRVDPEAIRESTIRNMLATAEEFEQFKEEVDEVRQEMVYSLQFEKKFQDVESLLKEDEKLMAAEEDIERWFQRCWWRRGDPQTCRQEMLNSGAVDMYHKVTKEPGKPLSRGPLPNPNKPAKKPEKIEPKADKKINALFAKACAREKVEEPDKNKHVKKSPMKPVAKAEKEEILKTSPLFKKTARKTKIDDLEDEVEEMQIENKTPPKRGKRIDFDMSQDIFSTGDSPSPKEMDVDDEEDFDKPPTKKTKSKAKKAAAKRNIFEAKPKEEEKEEAKASTSKAEEKDKSPKVVKSKEIGHNTYVDEDGFIVTQQKTVTVERELTDGPVPQKSQVKRGTTPATEGAPPAKKKAPKGQAKISSFFGAPKK